MDWFLDLSGEREKLERSAPFASPTTPPLRVGARIADRFELIEHLGEGGGAVVYHARELASGRSVALKFLRETSSSSNAEERLRREGVVTAALRHPGIVSIHGAGSFSGRPYLVYEYVAGGRTLAHVLQEGAPRDEVLRILRDAAIALGAAHEQGVVHRDIKPSNILLTPDGTARVADFGLVCGGDLEALTKSGEVMGTPLYMPVEQFDSSRRAEATVDVWALGMILYEVITGEPAFAAAGSLVELIGCAMHAPIEPRRVAPSLEPELEAICKRALERDPALRYPDARDFAADLSRFIAGERAPGNSRWRPVAALGAVVLVVSIYLLSAAKDESLSMALAEYAAGRTTTAAVESSLEANPRAPAELRAEAHLALAAGEVGDSQEWERRRGHAQRAAALDPSVAHTARALEGRALLELGQYSDARAAYAQARAAGGDASLWLEEAEGLALGARFLEARRSLAGYRNARPQDTGHLHLELAIVIGVDPEGGRELLARRRAELDASAVVVMQARLAEATGGDAFGLLYRHARAHPHSPPVSEALVLAHVERAELAEARQALAGFKAPESLHRAMEGLLVSPKRDLAPARRLPRRWKLAVGRCLIKLARTELAFARQRLDPRYESGPGGIPAAQRAERAERYLQFVRSELRGESVAEEALLLLASSNWTRTPESIAEASGLNGPEARLVRAREHLNHDRAPAALVELAALPHSGPLGARVLLLEARALAQLGEHEKSLSTLEDYSKTQAYELGSYQELLQVVEELVVALPQARDELQRLTKVWAPEKLSSFTAAGVQRGEDPFHWNRLYLAGVRSLQAEPSRSLGACHLAVARAPRLSSNLRSDLFRLSRGNSLLGVDEAPLRTLRGTIEAEGWLGRFVRASLGAGIVELEGGEPATRELDLVLDENPGVVFARELRVIMLVRVGRLKAAREDLAVLREAFPEGLPTMAFANVLLLAKEAAPSDQIVEAILEARERGFRAGQMRSWDATDYPELLPYLEIPKIRRLLVSPGR